MIRAISVLETHPADTFAEEHVNSQKVSSSGLFVTSTDWRQPGAWLDPGKDRCRCTEQAGAARQTLHRERDGARHSFREQSNLHDV